MKVAIVLVAVAALAGCNKAEPKKHAPATAPVTAGKVLADGTRQVPITVKNDGYDPGTIQAKPNEKLVLVFTRVEDGECGSQVKVGSGKVIDLPLMQPIEIPVTVPASGKVAFACGMDMLSGVIVVGS